MRQLIDISAARQNINNKQCLDRELESEFIGMVKQLFWNQMSENYEKPELVSFVYSYLDYENRSLLENYIEDNPSLKLKYNDLTLHTLKKSAK